MPRNDGIFFLRFAAIIFALTRQNEHTQLVPSPFPYGSSIQVVLALTTVLMRYSFMQDVGKVNYFFENRTRGNLIF